jgi:beta-glucosidase-like glycosyl hydrolase
VKERERETEREVERGREGGRERERAIQRERSGCSDISRASPLLSISHRLLWLSPQPGSELPRANSRRVLLRCGRESVVLLRNNNGTLPLTALTNLTSILVTGPAADSLSYLAGGWTFHWQGPFSDDEFTGGSTILDGIRQQADDINIGDYDNIG